MNRERRFRFLGKDMRVETPVAREPQRASYGCGVKNGVRRLAASITVVLN